MAIGPIQLAERIAELIAPQRVIRPRETGTLVPAQTAQVSQNMAAP